MNNTTPKKSAASSSGQAAGMSSMLCYISASMPNAPQQSSPRTSVSYANLVQDSQHLARFYNSQTPPLGNSNVTDSGTTIQEEEKRSTEDFRMLPALRSPLAGDLASPQHCITSQAQAALATHLSVQHVADLSQPHTPTQSSAAVEMAASGFPSTPHHHPTFPIPDASLDSPTLLLAAAQSLLQPVITDLSQVTILCLWDKCQQEFSSLASLVTHLDQTHTLAMTQFICLWENCSRQMRPFDARYKLITHLRCHTGEKPYHCEVAACMRSFSRLENLKLHTRTHTGEKPYQCNFTDCSKKFNNTSDRAKHKKTHITRKPYACRHPGCVKSYTDPSSMRKHIKYIHRLKEADKTGLPLLMLRKRNSAYSSSSSSSSPSTPQQGSIIFHNPPNSTVGLPDPALHSSSPSHGNSAANPMTSHGNSAANPMTSQAQLVPMVQIAGKVGQSSQSVLVPAYQQPPVMMILANNSSSSSPSSVGTNWVTVPSSTTSSPAQLLMTNRTVMNNSSSSVEHRLRQQIAHLQQQLYQSQLAAARACQTPQLVAAVNQDLSPGRLEPVGTKCTDSGGGGVQRTMMVQTPSFHKITLHDQQSPLAMNGNMEQTPLTMTAVTFPSPRSQPPPRARAAHNSVAMKTAQPVQQYIPIPVVPAQEAQYLYMSQL